MLAHWTGDNFSRWSSMKDSVRNVLQFSLFGVPMTGADICGFQGNTNEELCSRWMQLGAFHPFYRGHTIRSARPQEPYQWDSVAEASRKAISIRYALLPYWSKLLWYAHTAGTPLIRAPFYEFPDEASLIGVDEQFFVGASLLAPFLAPRPFPLASYSRR
jgi:alpha-glucosidase